MPPKSPDHEGAGRREHRFLAGVKTVLHLENGDRHCEAVDLNRTGVMVVGDLPPTSDPEVQLTLTSTAGDLQVRARGRIAYMQQDAEGRTRLGLEFLDLGGADGENLEALVSRVVEGRVPAALEQLDSGASPEQVREALSRIPIPHRIQLALRALPKEREILFLDENLQVLDALARNPHVTMPEIVALVRRRKLLPTTLDVVARDHRWAGNEELRIMVATHNRVALPTAQRLVLQLSDPGLRKVLRKPGLHPALRQKILETVPEKRLKGW